MSHLRSFNRFILISLALLGLSVSSGNAALISNGSFESGTFSPITADGGTVSVAPGGSNIDGWTVHTDTIAWFENPDHPWGVLAPSDGNRFLDLTNYEAGTPFGGVSQDIATVSGQTYELLFDLGSSTDYGSSQKSGISASAGGTSQTFDTATPAGRNEWTTFSLIFNAISTTTTISLVGTTGHNYIGLDNVIVNRVSVVPVPAAVWLFGTALIGFVGMSRRRKVA